MFQERVYQEVCSVCGDNSITKDDISHLPFLERFIKETMRIFPPSYAVARQTTQEIKLSKVNLSKQYISWYTCIYYVIFAKENIAD